MKKKRFTPEQIANILKEFDNGKSVLEIVRDHGVSKAALYKWRERYAGILRGRKSSFKAHVC